MDVALALLGANDGIPMAHSPFPGVGDEGVVTAASTDASLQPDVCAAEADNGVGGYGFHPAAPSQVFVFSFPWPAAIRAALVQGTRPLAARTEAAVTAMPVTEQFGSLVLPRG